MPDLTDAMNMNRPSIYAAFGNKEELFKKALDRYECQSIANFRTLLDVPKLRDAMERFLLGAADSFASVDNPRGCLSVQGALVGGADATNVCQEANKSREVIVDLVAERLKKGIVQGDLRPDTNVQQLARFFVTVLQGMSVQSVSGASCTDLKAIASHALDTLLTK